MKKISRKPLADDQAWKEAKQKIPDTQLPAALNDKMQMLQPYLQKGADIITRPFYLEGEPPLSAVSIHLNKVIDDEALNQHILRPLMLNCRRESIQDLGAQNLIDAIYKTSITASQIRKINTFAALVQTIFDGFTVLLFDGIEEVLVIDIHGGEFRAIDAPPAEQTMRGSREGFIEILDVNIALVRRRLRDPNLVVEKTLVGTRTRTQAAILYIADIADPKIVSEVKSRIDQMNLDGIVASGYVEQFIEDNPYSIFPQTFTTERPDRMVPLLLEGRIGIIVNNTPLALVVPALFVQFIQASEDYYERSIFSSYIRILRYLALLVAISFPALYIALLSFQPELIPYDLVISFSRARSSVPFPVIVEALVMEIIIQLVIEAGLRLPQQIGQTVGVVSGIILGQAAISAKLASPIVILIISVSIICTYALPSASMVLTTRLLRLPIMLLAATFGIFGISFGWMIVQTHLIGLESIGVPYFSPLAPMRYPDLKDSFIRVFLKKMNRRPVSIPMQDRKRQGNDGKGPEQQ
ncbi:MAG: spore germination protein [Firmicutes bacterium HGW-Firmicutes-15]|nr:MAG: spore germination protein [Firmicutes bacterium HGW-Firmicutes-15]